MHEERGTTGGTGFSLRFTTPGLFAPARVVRKAPGGSHLHPGNGQRTRTRAGSAKLQRECGSARSGKPQRHGVAAVGQGPACIYGGYSTCIPEFLTIIGGFSEEKVFSMVGSQGESGHLQLS
jgi:hypothetical protein